VQTDFLHCWILKSRNRCFTLIIKIISSIICVFVRLFFTLYCGIMPRIVL